MPAFLLYLETSSENCSVAISKNNELMSLCEESYKSCSHDKNLHLFIKYCLEGAGILINDLNAVCIGKGPGSYTGLRISAATAKGLCYSLNIPLITINSLEILIYKHLNKNYDFIFPILGIGNLKKRMYTAIFKSDGKNLVPAFSTSVNTNLLKNYENKKNLVIGDIVTEVKNFNYQQNLFFTLSKFITQYPSSKDMILTGWKLFKKKKFESIIHFEPCYMKEFI